MLVACGLAIAGTTLALPAAASAQLNVHSMVALGDSLTAGAGSGGPEFSWATGLSMNSVYKRLNDRSPGISRLNVSHAGDVMNDLIGDNGQAQKAVNAHADFVTIMIGTNDICHGPTSVGTFRSQFTSVMNTLTSGIPSARIFVTSIPNWGQLYSLFQGDSSVVNTWTNDGHCPLFLTPPGPSADTQQHLIDLNVQLAQVCAAHPQCTFDGNALYSHQFAQSDFAGNTLNDFFHWNAQGEQAVADAMFPIADSGQTPSPPAPPPPPPTTTTTPPPPAPVPTVKLPAKLTIDRASIHGGRLDSLLTITGAATGSVTVQYLAGGRSTTFTAPVGAGRQGAKHVKILRTLVGGQRRTHTGIITVTYRGNSLVQADTLRSRAANNASGLRRTQLSFAGAHLILHGTVKRNVTGYVRLRVLYTRADGTPIIWLQNVRIVAGQWSTDEQLPAEAAADPNAYLAMEFTGNGNARGGPYRGEQLGKGLGNLPKG
jgi:lysophospholipase L1-like esterase